MYYYLFMHSEQNQKIDPKCLAQDSHIQELTQ